MNIKVETNTVILVGKFYSEKGILQETKDGNRLRKILGFKIKSINGNLKIGKIELNIIDRVFNPNEYFEIQLELTQTRINELNDEKFHFTNHNLINEQKEIKSIKPIDFDLWNKVKNTTWFRSNSWTGHHYIFYQNIKNEQGCIKALLGSGVRTIHNEIIGTNFLKNSIIKDDNLLICENSELNKISDEIIINNPLQGEKIDFEKIKKLEISIGSEKRKYNINEDINLFFRIQNTNKSEVKFCYRQTPFEDFKADIFKINDNENRISYVGKKVKRRPATLKDFIELKPNEIISKKVIISNVYKINTEGKYSITFIGSKLNSLKNSNTIEIIVTKKH